MFERILSEIGSGVLKAGDVLPSRHQCMRRFKYSRGTVDAAIGRDYGVYDHVTTEARAGILAGLRGRPAGRTSICWSSILSLTFWLAKVC